MGNPSPETTATRDRILDAATTLFSEHGADGVTTARIAQTAGVNKALIFYHFGSKEKLFHVCFSRLLDAFSETLRSGMATSEPGLPAIEAFVRNHIRLIRENQSLFRIVFRTLSLDAPGNKELVNAAGTVIRLIRNDLLKAFMEARARGEIRDVDPLQTMVSIISLNAFFFIARPLLLHVNSDADPEAFEKERVDHVVNLLLNGLRAPKEHI